MKIDKKKMQAGRECRECCNNLLIIGLEYPKEVLLAVGELQAMINTGYYTKTYKTRLKKSKRLIKIKKCK